jgi:hypothetical protein
MLTISSRMCDFMGQKGQQKLYLAGNGRSRTRLTTRESPESHEAGWSCPSRAATSNEPSLHSGGSGHDSDPAEYFHVMLPELSCHLGLTLRESVLGRVRIMF